MSKVETPELEAAAIKAVAAQLNAAIEEGQRQSRELNRAICDQVDPIVHLGPRLLPLSSAIVTLAVLMVGETSGFLWAAAERNWPTCALFVVLMTLGIFLLDQVRLIQRREEAFRAGLYVAAASQGMAE